MMGKSYGSGTKGNGLTGGNKALVRSVGTPNKEGSFDKIILGKNNRGGTNLTSM